MTTRIDQHSPSSVVQLEPSAARATPAPARPFATVLAAGSQAAIASAEAAVRNLPGGIALSAPLRGGTATPVSSAASPSVASTPEGSMGTAGSSALSSELDPSAGADRNLYYLQLQEKISAESREYSTVSNVLKSRHDSMKNAISNLR